MDTPWPALADISHMYLLVANWSNRHFPLVTYKRLDDRDPAYIDTVHDEVREEDKEWYDDIDLRAFAVPADQMFPLTVFGSEELRDVVLQASVPSLIAVGLATQDATTKEITLIAKTGDHFVYSDSYRYDILLWKRGPGFGNTDVPLYYFASAEKVRKDAFTYE